MQTSRLNSMKKQKRFGVKRCSRIQSSDAKRICTFRSETWHFIGSHEDGEEYMHE